MNDDIILHVCPLCGNLGIIHPGTPPSENKNDWQFFNRCPGHRLSDVEKKNRGGSKTQRGTDRHFRGRDNNRFCRFPFTDASGNPIGTKPEYREMKDGMIPVDEIAAKILSDYNVDPGFWN